MFYCLGLHSTLYLKVALSWASLISRLKIKKISWRKIELAGQGRCGVPKVACLCIYRAILCFPRQDLRVLCFLQNSSCLVDLEPGATSFLLTLGLSYESLSTAPKLRWHRWRGEWWDEQRARRSWDFPRVPMSILFWAKGRVVLTLSLLQFLTKFSWKLSIYFLSFTHLIGCHKRQPSVSGFNVRSKLRSF